MPLVTGEIYHVVNRGVGGIPIFKEKKDYQRFLKTLLYYQRQTVPFRFSRFLTLPKEEQEKILLENKKVLVEIISYCLMPNHFHFLLKQTVDEGILRFLRLATNSYSRFFNLKYKRNGALFGARFKATRIESEEQLLHVSRYIHLNPYSGFLVKDLKNLFTYHYSSLPEYLNLSPESYCQKEIITAYFKNPANYRKFISNQADYQRSLDLIKHKTLEK